MALNGVPVYNRGVARRRLIRNTQPQPSLPPIGIIFKLNLDTVFRQVPDPARTTASTGIAPHLHRNAAEPRHAIKRGLIRGAHRRKRFGSTPASGKQETSRCAERLAQQ